MNETEKRQQEQHEAVLKQMKISNVLTGVIAVAALGGAISFFASIFK